jgi:RecB family exonuclease
MSDKPHISPSQLESFCRCPEAYRRRYLDGEIIPPGIAILKGTAFHGGAAVNMRQKIESHVDLPVADIVDAARAAFDQATHGEYQLSAEEQSRGAAIVLGEAIDDTLDMVHVHARQQAPDYQPVLVEEKLRIVLPNAPRDLLGIIDLADDQDRVIDFKTAGRKKNQADADDSVQLTVYDAAFRVRFGRAPKEVRLDAVIQTKTKTERQVVASDRSGDDFNALANRINVVTAAIEAGSFPPATPGAWWCGPRWCGYHSTCPFVNSARSRKEQGD